MDTILLYVIFPICCGFLIGENMVKKRKKETALSIIVFLSVWLYEIFYM